MSEMTIPEYDVMVLKQQSEEAERRHKRALARWSAAGGAGIALAVAGGAVGIAYVIWLALAGPSASDVHEQEIRLSCVENGGTWLPLYGACLATGTTLTETEVDVPPVDNG